MSSETQALTGARPAPSLRTGLLSRRPWTAVVLLMFLGVVNYVDRTLPGVLAEPLKRELGLSDTFLGVLNGVAFLSVYAVAGIPIARLADGGRYGAVITGALALWSAMTALGGMVVNGWQLAATRIGVALGEAGSTPAAHAYISRNFAPERRGAALALCSLGAPIGGMMGLIAGGLIGEALGWRMTLIVMGVFGMVLAPLVLLALGPGQPIPIAKKETGGDVLALLRKPSLVAILAATSFISMGGYSALAFTPAFLMRVHELSIGVVGVQMGLWQGGIGAVALVGSGWLGGVLGKRDPRLMLAVLAAMCLICAPIAAVAFTVGDAQISMICAAIGAVLASAYLGLTVACLHSLVPLGMRARASAVLLFCSALFGSLGPLIVGGISDRLQATYGDVALGHAMLVVPVVYTLAAISFLAAMSTFGRDQVRETA